MSLLPACRRPEEKIIPYVNRPEAVVPGRPLHFATALPMMGTALGVIVESHEGRPTKIEGNPLHSESRGGTSAFAQAAILDLYDPDRSHSPQTRGLPQTWDAASQVLSTLGQKLQKDKGRSLTVITGCPRSPTLAAALHDLKVLLPDAQILRYEPFDRAASQAGTQALFGEPLEAVYSFSKADVVLALDADPLGLDCGAVRMARDWAGRRAPESGAMNRVYTVESTWTTTGANADHRYWCESARVLSLLCGLLSILSSNHQLELDATLATRITELGAPALQNPWRKRLEVLASELASKRGRSLIIPGARQSKAVHALAHFANWALDNVGSTLQFAKTFDGADGGVASLGQVTKGIASGNTEAVLMLGVNPVYDAPGDIDFAGALSRVAMSIHLGCFVDETATACTWHLNRAHSLESWGDVVAADGTASILQPLIAPLWGGKTDAEVVRLLTGQSSSAHDQVRAHWLKQWGQTDFDNQWRRALHSGVVESTASTVHVAKPNLQGLGECLNSLVDQSQDRYEVIFTPDAHTYDGQFANNAWLQETPEPFTKVTWGNVAKISRAIADEHGLSDGDLVTLGIEGRQIHVPVVVLSGQADTTIALSVGQGHTPAGLRSSSCGVNVNPLRVAASPFRGSCGIIKKTGNRVALARTQEHFSTEGRDIARDIPLTQVAIEHENQGQGGLSRLEKLPSGSSHAFGMGIDLSKCLGCNACVVACQAENNVSVVGADGVRRGRHMHWLRLDRYFTGTQQLPGTIAQPVTCQQCENAPCETVCPAGATSHSPDGLNDMVYNRCVGSRYCANNCPFKARRFNYFEYWATVSEPRRMQLNPDVTVRSRGVMEKCTYCVQRVNGAKLEAKQRGTAQLADGAIVTACEQACPAGAITFGDFADRTSRLAMGTLSRRCYRLLEELNLQPHTYYLAKVRNPNPELES
jgi:molybdopterin-containing oxidoreductase family iron-sulfur binding subunit